MYDPQRSTAMNNLAGKINFRRVDANGQLQLQMNILEAGNLFIIDGIPPIYDAMNVPFGEYIMVKVK